MNQSPIYILHGWTYSTEKWQVFVKDLESVAPVILLKIPGLTDSIDAPWTLDDYVAWLETQLGTEKKVILLGHSNGGRIALAYALKNPKKLKQLVLIDSAGVRDKRVKAQIKRLVFRSLAKVGKNLINQPLARRLLHKLAREKDYYEASPIMRQTMQNLIETDLEGELKNISIPTLIIWGRRDQATPVRDALTIKRGLPQSRLVIVDEARHSPMYTHPKEVIKQIKAFVDDGD